MSSGIDQLVEMWASDDQFREDFRAEPETAVKDRGISLSDDQWEAIRGLDAADMSDAELQERVNKEG
jgi:hypothetical protein